MSESRVEIAICRLEEEQFTLESLATRAGVHPVRLESLMEHGLLEAREPAGARSLFDATSLDRLRVIERLRRDLGVNLAGIAVILEMRDRLTALQRELALWRARSQASSGLPPRQQP